MLRLGIPLAIFASLIVLLVIGLDTAEDRTKVVSPLVGRVAPEFNLPRLHEPDTEWSTRELDGQPYVLNVWGSWCYACREEHPWMERLAEESGIPLVGFNWKDERSEALTWLERFGDVWTIHITDYEGDAAIDWGVYGAPETFLVDAEGVIRHKIIGPLDEEIFHDLMSRIDEVRQEAES